MQSSVTSNDTSLFKKILAVNQRLVVAIAESATDGIVLQDGAGPADDSVATSSHAAP